ncbi:MAG TPA: DNA repair exonuclease [Pyrinomonadaceae bacterium]|jgi:DNA repair exonuclease SbcCD nuclease subunit|nr:DNA repair exonuclease [Pyrinomonadaceae bacterium]
MKFLHLADIHLGCRRYNVEERTTDFFRAWSDVIVRHALPNAVDFVLICGDFFNSRKVDPQAMNHAIIGLQMLKDAGIPVVAIEGNHDQHESDAVNRFSWMRSLSQWGYLILLEPDTRDGFNLVPWNEEERSGSYIDIAGARIFGTHWFGTSTNAAVPLVVDALRRARGEELFNILMLHTDVEGQLNRPNIPALSISRMKELRALVDYVALGHTHKRFEIEDWAFNPGSLEACTIDEFKEERGLYLVEVDEQRRVVAARHSRDYTQRPFQRLNFDVSGAPDAEAVHAGVLEVLRLEARTHDAGQEDSPAPIIEINLRGHLGFKNSLLDIPRMREEARALTGALHIMISNRSVPVEYAVAAGLDSDATRQVRERRIIEDLITRDIRFRARAHDMAALTLEAKRLALGDESPEKILNLIEQQLELDAGQTDGSAPLTGAADAADTAPAEALATGEGELVASASALQAIERNAAT